MQNDTTNTKWLYALRRVAAPIMGTLFVGRVSTAATAYPRGGVLRFILLP